MSNDCSIYQTKKSTHLQSIGRLMPLALLITKWKPVAIKEEEDGMNTICIVVNKAIKICHFILCNNAITAKSTVLSNARI